MAVDLFDNWFDPIETGVRARAREFIEEMIRERARRGAGPPALRAKPDGRRWRKTLALRATATAAGRGR